MASLSPAHLHGLAAVLGALGAGNNRSASRRPVGQGFARAGGRIAWDRQTFQNPADLVAWMNARGQHTTLAQFLGRHPGVAAEYGQRGVSPGGGRVGAGGFGGQPHTTPIVPGGVIGLPRTSGGPPGQFGPPAFQGGPAQVGGPFAGQPHTTPITPRLTPPAAAGNLIRRGLPQSLGVRRRQARQPLMAALLNR